MSTLKEQRNFLQSLSRGLSLLKFLAESGRPLTLSELAKGIGTNNATATRICFTLTQTGFLSRNEQRRYFLTPNVLSLGYSAICTMEWREIARYYLEALFEEVQGNVNLAILDGTHIIYLIHLAKTFHPIKIQTGSKLPVHSTAAGKALLAFQPEKIIKNILKKINLRPLTPNTITKMDQLLGQLENIRKMGYAINHEETSIMVSAVAAPIKDKNNNTIAAVTISINTLDYSRDKLETILAPKVVRVAEQISRALDKIEGNISFDSAI